MHHLLTRLFNPDSVHGLLENSAINFLAPYSFSSLYSLIKIRSPYLQKTPYFIVYVILIASTNVTSALATAVCNAILAMKIFCY